MKASEHTPLCDHCNEVLGTRYFAGVPGAGNLCLVCHIRFIRSMESALAAARRDPDGYGDLTEFEVTIEEVWTTRVLVHANCPEEARQVAAMGVGAQLEKPEPSGFINEDGWSVIACEAKKGKDKW